MLESLGERIVTARSGEDALRRILSEDFAVILLDVRMPTLDGIETARFIRDRERNVNTPIIFVTAGANDERLVREAYSLGAVDYVLKPVASEILCAKVSAFVELFKARKLEEERSRELIVLNRELESFSYSVSHDLRAPVLRMKGFCSALRDQLPQDTSDEGWGYLERIEKCAADMDHLIDSLLRLARITSSEMRLTEVNLSAMAQELAASLHQSSPDRDVRFEIGEGLTCRGDRSLLRVALENLLANAWKYSVEVSPAVIELGEEVVDGEHRYFVRDNGAGFDVAYADRLFTVFQRLHSSARFEGTGVGLATVERVIRKHGGRVWGEGAIGEGAVFKFTIGTESSFGSSASE
jgi:light-regulated signal transduction histidine kinase (bacteriophytochrome)